MRTTPRCRVCVTTRARTSWCRRSTPAIATAVNDATLSIGRELHGHGDGHGSGGRSGADGHGGLHGLRAGRHDLHGHAVRDLQRPPGGRRWHRHVGHVHADRRPVRIASSRATTATRTTPRSRVCVTTRARTSWSSQATPAIATAVNDATLTIGQTLHGHGDGHGSGGRSGADGHGGLHGLRAGRHDLHGHAVRDLQRPPGGRRWHRDLRARLRRRRSVRIA